MLGHFTRRSSIALLLCIPVALGAQTAVNIRLGTLAPDNSPWTVALRSMGATWTKTTNGRVRLVVYPGTIPSESSAIARMAVDGLQAATLMVAGLSEIDESFNVFGLPFFFESDAELLHVQRKLAPHIAERLRARRYHLLNWANGGWVQLFSKRPIRSLDDLKKAKLYTTEGSPKIVQWFTANGFHAVPLATGEIPRQLKLPTGAIDATPSPPVFALALQFFRDAPYMLDVRLAPLVGATVMTDAAWNRISVEDRAAIQAGAQAMEQQVNAQASSLDARSISEMKNAGLQVVSLDAKAAADFQSAAQMVTATQRGELVPPDIYDLALRERDAFRKTKPVR